jgi:hypothetical protein
LAGRLFFLDQTLQRIIQRFEDEYPETKVPEVPSLPNRTEIESLGPSLADATVLSASVTSDSLEQVPSSEEYMAAEENPSLLKLTRTSSNTSLAAKAYTDEEGRMHRFGQGVRREVLRQSEINDGTDLSKEHLDDLRNRYDNFKGEELRAKIASEGPDEVLKELGMNATELSILHKEDPESFKIFAQSQIAAQINSGRRLSEA